MQSPERTRPHVPPGRRPTLLAELLAAFKIDFPNERAYPAAISWVAATVISIVGSLVTDALLVLICEAIFPSTKGFVHFQFSDYGKLTVIGVVIACLAWPVTTAISSAPRWVFLRMAVLVTLVLWLPDIWILIHGEPPRAVAFLMLMHLAIALVTYNALVHLAPPRRTSEQKRALRRARRP